MADAHYVYLYRSMAGVAKYVGYGMSVERAISHTGHSHNDQLRAWLQKGDFELSVVGPYRDEVEGKNVEAALISSLHPEFNIAPGDGPKFVPIGVPPALGDRPTMPPLTLADLGVITGGALLVYLAPGILMKDGRRKFDPAQPDDQIIVADTEGFWDLTGHRDAWTADPASGPQALLGIYGNVRHRFIAGAMAIDTLAWFHPDLEHVERRRWRVPLSRPVDLDVDHLRGRRVTDIRFGQFSWQLHIWVDAEGHQRHPALSPPASSESLAGNAP